MRVFMPGPVQPAFSERLRENLDEGIVLLEGPMEPWPTAIDVLIRGRPDEEELDRAGPIRALVIPYAGVPERTLRLLTARPQIAVYNLHHNAAPTSEQALALLLAVAKRICPRDAALRRGDWSARYAELRSLLLEGRGAVILGAGAIGRRLERACLALGMVTECLGRADLFEAGEGDLRRGLHEVLPRAQVLLLALPLTQETQGLLTARELELLPAGSVLVNIARGPIVDQWALYDALRSGHLSGAGLDVWWNYPETEEARPSCMPSEAPLHELDQVVMSPHLAGHTDRTEALRAEHLARLLLEITEGRASGSLVDLTRGY